MLKNTTDQTTSSICLRSRHFKDRGEVITSFKTCLKGKLKVGFVQKNLIPFSYSSLLFQKSFLMTSNCNEEMELLL